MNDTTSTPPRLQGLAHACAGALGGNSQSRTSPWRPGYLPGEAEREHLAATLGALLRRLRTEAGLSVRALADRSTVAESTIERLEAGTRRPRPATLGAIAYGLNPARAVELAELLAAAAGPSLRPDTAAGLRQRARRLAKARREAGVARWQVWQESEAARCAAAALSTQALARLPLGAGPEAAEVAEHLAVLDRAARLQDRAERLRDVLKTAHPLERRFRV